MWIIKIAVFNIFPNMILRPLLNRTAALYHIYAIRGRPLFTTVKHLYNKLCGTDEKVRYTSHFVVAVRREILNVQNQAGAVP